MNYETYIKLLKLYQECMRHRSVREQRVILLYFGLIDGKHRTFEEIGKILNITSECAKLIVTKNFRRYIFHRRSKPLCDFLD